MANLYQYKVASIMSDRVVLVAVLSTHTKHPQQSTRIELRADGIDRHFAVGQRVDLDLTLTPYVDDEAQKAVQP